MDTPEKRFMKTLAGEVTDRPPFWFMRQAGRYLPEYRKLRRRKQNFLDFCYSPKLAAEAALQPVRRFSPDAAILFSDILVIPDALGQPVRFIEGKGPELEPVTDGKAVSKLSLMGVTARLAPVYEAAERTRNALPPQTPLIGFAGAPWTIAVYMVQGQGGTDCAGIKDWAARDAKGFGALINVLTEAVVQHLSKQIEAGAEAVQIFDSWAGVLDEAGFKAWCVEPAKRIVENLKARHPNTPVIGFPRGAGDKIGNYVEKTGVTGLSIDAEAPLEKTRDALSGKTVIQGNLDNKLLLRGGAEMEAETRRILETMKGHPFIFNLGHGVLPKTPVEHVARVCEIVRTQAGHAGHADGAADAPA